ncbi:5-formaminoimidazole-4-carboxamide-1-(beta)-D- ribofuranosyl 5'-monophosphate synthetase-like protein [Vulcanisaeta moutnovskia 768-28]|uniref:5-formaminoimidazole-4-carboxamide-1-(Beta)-D-ribofuranosyl 5'-monophosphate synthetase-like protein n=1 Tax=Vulcanisaeta moutnovskia (strain 768-28) TaxID=985053 RepID=F0QVX2_VULM7|nr:formate--phosphoribosylaminoimidazolecarboxamide ligase family protein [Vulcanisaeta moutnovskia]ADY02146.1 5-formaminoimidazole-4-carboxamide-1-(beta)-D- ribofuranosyl 5'-monophosphate synthetase-like protein [Vulcanisaeta moutnovskia 768-28]
MQGYSIAVLASHSALDVLDGARDEGFRTIAVAKRGRELPYREFSIIDRLIVLNDFVEIINSDVIALLRQENVIFVPNRSFAVYVGYDNIEGRFPIPIFGNRYLLRWEERVGPHNYYRLLDEAGIRRPRTFNSVDDVDRPVMVKLPESVRRVERGFFIARDRDDLLRKARRLSERGLIRLEDLSNASIEELVLGAHFNANYFYSRVRGRLELHSFDRRIQSNLDGVFRLPARDQLDIDADVRYIEVGHEMATIRESLLERTFEIGHRFAETTQRLVPPGVIGPFTLQFMVTPELDLVVYDVAPRIGGGTNIYMGIGSQYSKLYFGKPMSIGRRIAIEIKEATEQGKLEEVIT